MADTGWLQPAASSIIQVPGTPGMEWAAFEQMAIPDRHGVVSNVAILLPWSPGYPSEEGASLTKPLGFDWVVPSTLSIPSNAILVGIELATYPWMSQGTPTRQPECDAGFIDVQLGDAIMYQGPPIPPFWLGDNNNLPGPPPAHPINFGGPTFMGGVPAGTRVLAFLSQAATISAFGSRHAAFIVGALDPGGTEGLSLSISIWVRYAEMKLHWEIDPTQIDLGTDPDALMASVSIESDLQVIQKLAAVCVVDAIIEQAVLGNITIMKSNPQVDAGLPADITNGLGFIDSTAYPTVVFTIPDVDVALLRFKDMLSSPEVEVSSLARGPGKRINLSSSPKVSISAFHGFVNVIGIYSDPDITFSLNANLSADTDMVSSPKIYVTVTPNLQGDINLGSECGEAELTTVVSLIANLGYVKGLYSNPNIYVTLDSDGLVVGAALEFTPLVSVTIPFANLKSKFAEPAPDHRTIFKCPVDRTIRITRKDKTIL